MDKYKVHMKKAFSSLFLRLRNLPIAHKKSECLRTNALQKNHCSPANNFSIELFGSIFYRIIILVFLNQN